MGKQCIVMPTTGLALFNSLKKGLGYETAKEVFLKGISSTFINDHIDILQLDSLGIPTKESLLKTEYMKRLLGKGKIAKDLLSEYSIKEDTDANYSALVLLAYGFNTNSPHRQEFVAIVEYKDEGRIGITVHPKTDKLLQDARNLYATHLLNVFLSQEFRELGVTVGDLTEAEKLAGRVGVTDFNVARTIAQGFSSGIRIARNMEGALALSEEWCHMIVGVLKLKGNTIINRAINSLSNNLQALEEILGLDFLDIYDFHEGNMEEIAEEALGHILKENLIKEKINQNIPSKTLILRAKDSILNSLKGYDPTRVDYAIKQAESSMQLLASSILNEGLNFTRQDILNADRDVQFNALSDRVERSLKILKDIRNVELKRTLVYNDGNLEVLNNIKNHMSDDPEVIAEGILLYASHALNTLRELRAGFQNLNSSSNMNIFKLLRKAKLYVDSYATFINALSNLYSLEVKDNVDDTFTKKFTIGTEEIDMDSIISELLRYSKDITLEYLNIGIPAFAEVLKPFLGENLTKKLQKELDTEDVIEALLRRSPGDISVFDRYIDSMGDSSDVILQLLDAKVKEVKDKERLKTIKEVKEIQKLMLEAEKRGIKSFEWAFEHYTNGGKTGEYVSIVNVGLFRKDQKEFLDYLKNKYGENPTGLDAADMLLERNDWIKEHCHSKFLPNQPSLTKYESQEYKNLSEDLKYILSEFLKLKSKYDKKLSDGRAYTTKAIQRRKSSEQRFLDVLGNPTKLYENIKESIKEDFLDAEDDNAIFGESIGLKGFDGHEFMNLPIVYTNRLSKPDELSTDIFGSLAAYAHMANRFEAMSGVIDALEVGSHIILTRDTTATRGGNKLVEKLKDGAEIITTIINKGDTNQARKVRDFMRALVYQRHMVDHGKIGKLNTTKTINWLLKLGSKCTMAFNWLADSANVANAVALANIEAIAGEYFNVSELFYADTEYTKAMASYIPELGNRIKKNKLWLVDELLDINQDFDLSTQRTLKKSLTERIMGTNWGSMGQLAGNHWLMNRVAIAYMSRIKVRIPEVGEKNLWEALTTKNSFKDSNDIKEVALPEGTTLVDGGEVNLGKIGREIAQINHRLLGIYNQDDANAANLVALGRAVMQYRKWMKPILNARFQPKRENVLMDNDTEGFYITAFKLGRDLIRAKFLLGEVWGLLDNHLKRNVRRFITEITQLALVYALVNLIDWPDDEDRPWAVKFAEYMATRELRELAGITPFGLRELGKTFKEPFPIYRQIDSAVTLLYSVIDPRDYYTEVESGPYKGFTVLEKNIMNAPIPIVAQWNLIEKFGTGLEEAMKWYVKP